MSLLSSRIPTAWVREVMLSPFSDESVSRSGRAICNLIPKSEVSPSLRNPPCDQVGSTCGERSNDECLDSPRRGAPV